MGWLGGIRGPASPLMSAVMVICDDKSGGWMCCWCLDLCWRDEGISRTQRLGQTIHYWWGGDM